MIKKKPARELQKGQEVFAEDFSSKNERKIPGTVQEVIGPLSCRIRLEDNGRLLRVDVVQS